MKLLSLSEELKTILIREEESWSENQPMEKQLWPHILSWAEAATAATVSLWRTVRDPYPGVWSVKARGPEPHYLRPVRVLGNKTIVTNGDQTDTIYEGMDRQQTFEQSLRCREFEPDGPNYTPRISGIMHIENGNYNFAMSILKSSDGNPDSCSRFTYAYEKPLSGEGRFIHTYMNDGNPLPSFEGEPKRIAIEGDIDSFTKNVWESLNEDNKVSLFVRFIDIETGKYETRIVNKNH